MRINFLMDLISDEKGMGNKSVYRKREEDETEVTTWEGKCRAAKRFGLSGAIDLDQLQLHHATSWWLAFMKSIFSFIKEYKVVYLG